ncbi:MAG TPA: Rossmann-like and DUF2520 domain-containing protein [Polyangiaceae bacterium]|nr:Rossmann-like and DUF2520 domain-containing protein [Polyangiaceae bacterium]
MARRRKAELPSVFVLGTGKVGSGLARSLRGSGARVTLRSARRALPRKVEADVVILAVRDRDIPSVASRMLAAGRVPRRAVVLHVSGALDAEALAVLRGHCKGVGQMHPMISFASVRTTPDLTRGNMHVQGDAAAAARARVLARALGMTPRTVPRLDPVAYHAAAGLVANGAAALTAVGADLLEAAGVTRATAPALLGPLLRSVADNVEKLGFPEALTGPVRRGDVSGFERHIATLRAKLPRAVPLYLAAAQAQLPLARAIGDAPRASFDAIERAIRRAT